ncbi:2742_t:CDS:2 [Gigaspora margarita]|uniref:2742_t:CDS:1 n=1 Tax=Gigaspora margarita TaxID=4874 RepID=A0ABN7V4G2_GIGMA|nr:2742_t:CDS:2 [Gigaspora margarita]
MTFLLTADYNYFEEESAKYRTIKTQTDFEEESAKYRTIETQTDFKKKLYQNEIENIGWDNEPSNEEDDRSTNLKTKKLKEFISFESFLNHLYDNYQIIPTSSQINHTSKYKRLEELLGFINAHVKSYFNMFHTGETYYIEKDCIDLRDHRARYYENDFNIWFKEINNICEEFGIKYIWSRIDLEDYFKKHLEY